MTETSGDKAYPCLLRLNEDTYEPDIKEARRMAHYEYAARTALTAAQHPDFNIDQRKRVLRAEAQALAAELNIVGEGHTTMSEETRRVVRATEEHDFAIRLPIWPETLVDYLGTTAIERVIAAQSGAEYTDSMRLEDAAMLLLAGVPNNAADYEVTAVDVTVIGNEAHPATD
jgi:integrase